MLKLNQKVEISEARQMKFKLDTKKKLHEKEKIRYKVHRTWKL